MQVILSGYFCRSHVRLPIAPDGPHQDCSPRRPYPDRVADCWCYGLFSPAIPTSVVDYPRMPFSQVGRRRFESGVRLHIFNNLRAWATSVLR
jgi:hypothetical protein